MLSLRDEESIRNASLDPPLRELVNERLEQLRHNYGGDLEDIISFLVVEPADSQREVTDARGFSILMDQVGGGRVR